VKNQTELRKVKKAIAALKKQLAGLQKRQQELEASLGIITAEKVGQNHR
jgi:hypothetical protein